MDNNMLTILTSEDRDEIKQSLKNVIIEPIESDFRESTNYLFDANDISDMLQEAIKEVKAEIKPLMKDYLLQEMQKKLGIEI